MSEEKTQPPEKSLRYMSWSFKELIIELKKINENIEKLSNIIAKNSDPF